MGLRRWTEAEEAELKARYRTETAAEIGQRIGRPIQAVRLKAWRLGLGLGQRRGAENKCYKRLTQEQEWLLRREYPHVATKVLAVMLGLSPRTVIRRARAMGLEKTAQFMRESQRHTAKKAQESHLKNGTYPERGVVNENLKKGEAYRFKPGHGGTYRGGRKPGSKNRKAGTQERATA